MLSVRADHRGCCPLRARTALVTGASSGIGRATPRAIARAGAAVTVAARNAFALELLVTEIEAEGGHALAVPIDIVDHEQVDRAITTTVDTFGRLDIVVNTVGT